MEEDLDVSEVLDAVERVQRGYRKPLPGSERARDRSTKSLSRGNLPGDDGQQSSATSKGLSN
jgi:hypothetical protein